MSRLRLRGRGSEPARDRKYSPKAILIVGGGVGAATLTIAYPAVGLSLNVGVVVLGTLYAIAKDSEQITKKSKED